MSIQKRIHKIVVSFLLLSTFTFLLCGLSGCTFPGTVDKEKTDATQQKFQLFLSDQFTSSFENELINLHFTLKNPENYGITKPAKASSNISLDYAQLLKDDLLKTRTLLGEINKNHLTKEQQRIYITLEKYLNQQITLCNYPQFLNLLSCGTGLSSTLPLTLAEYSFYTEEDIKDYLSILTQIPDLLSQALHWEVHQTDIGYGMSAFEITDTIEQIDIFLNSGKSNLLLDTFDTRINRIPDLSKDQLLTYCQNNKELVEKRVIPAFQTLKKDLNALKNRACEGKGLFHYQDGLSYYEAMIASMTLSDRPLSTMIRSLEKRLEDLTSRVSTVVFKNPDIYHIYYELEERNDSVFNSPKEMLTSLEEMIQADFPKLTNVSYQVNPIPKALENESTAAYYLIPPLDSPEENRIYYSNSFTKSPSLFITLAHEGYPGHLYHQNYLLQHGLTPIFYLLDMTGYKEGWAFYAEIEAADYYNFGQYEEKYHDDLVELYRCNLEYSYCISSLIDLYVNAKGYSKEDIQTFASGIGMDEEAAVSLYEFVIEEPGTYLQYYIGYLEILEMRQNFMDENKHNFDLKAFHTAFLDFGPCYYGDLAKYLANQY